MLTFFSAGSAEQILETQYMDHCDNTLDDFCAIFWPCSFVGKKNERCVNVKERHVKGHQNSRGTIIGSGPYESDFTFDNFCGEWFKNLKYYLTKSQNELESEMTTSRLADEVVVTNKLHNSNVKQFYYRVGGARSFYSHATCLCCLRELAEHPLPCGHVLCTACVKAYGKAHEELSASFTISACPLHDDHQSLFPAPMEVHFKPPLAGVRILSLDG